jgi:Zn-dependent protease with chaperone function
MYRFLSTRTLLVIALLVSFSIAQSPRDPNEENPIIDELTKIADKQTVDKFVAATGALDSGRYDDAKILYKEVLTKAPEFDHALRRLGYTLVALGDRPGGLALTKQALDKNRSIPNLIGHATSLVSSNSADFRPTPSEINEANSLGREAWDKSNGTEEDAGVVVAETLLMANKLSEFKSFARTFRMKKSDSARAAYYNAIGLADDGDLDAAEAEIARSRELGAPEEFLAPAVAGIAQIRNEQFFGLGRFRGLVYPIVGLVALWAVGLLALFIVGRHLSKKTMRSIEESDPNDTRGEAQAALKKIYRRVVSIAGIYYYISQPVVIFLIIAFTLGVVLFFLAVGRIPIGLIIGVVFVGAASIFYTIKSLLTRAKIEDPGRALSEAEAPGLWELVRNVASTVQTRPVNEIRITQGTDLAVYERGSFRQKMSDNADRVLILGTAVLNDFDQNAFRAVLAHEYGHFSNRDTAGGDIAYRVNTDIVRIAQSMVESETNTVYNIGFQFLRLFHFIFRRITHGASRLQEVLADRVAAYHFGADSFREGLRHVIRREVEFMHVADKEINAALGSNRAVSNLYELTVSDDLDRQKIDQEFEQALQQETSEDDTHPSARDRFRYIEGSRSAEIEPLHGKVWDLFTDRAAITAEMNSLIEKLVRPSYQQSDSTLGI